MIVGSGPRQGHQVIDRGAPSWGVRRVAPSLVARSLILCIASVITVLSYYAWFSVIGQHWRHVIAENRLLAHELRMGIFNEERARLSFPRPERIHGFLKFLRDNKLSIFAEWRTGCDGIAIARCTVHMYC